ncbi:retrovirus-related pol polyprotein from transposon TNT 1-94 [Tanacetum coccineum]
MHNNIMAAGSMDCPYTPSTFIIPAVPATENSPAVPEQTTVETILNMSPENKAHFESEKEAIHLLLTGIGDEIYSTVDACKTAHEMWEVIERLQQGESLNIQDVRTNLFWEFGKIISHEGEIIESYYTRFYKMMNEMIRNNLTVATMQNANPLALVAAAQQFPDPYYQPPKSHKSYAPTSKASLPTRFHATTRHKGKEIVKPIKPTSESASEEDSDPEQTQKDKEMQKNLALITKYFKKIYKPTNNNLRTSSNNKNKNVDTTPRYKNDNQNGQNPKRVKDSTYHKEKMLIYKQAGKGVQLATQIIEIRTAGSQRGFNTLQIDEQELEAHYSYMAKIQEVPTADSGTDSEPLEQVQYDAGYNMFANEIHHSEQPESICNTCVVETGDSNVIPDSQDMCDNDIQNDQNVVECDDECVALANLIANLKLDVDKNKKIQKHLKKANTALAHELTEGKSILVETSRTLGESNRLLAQRDIDIKEGLKLKAYEILVVQEKHDELVKQSLLTKSHYEGLVKEKTKIPHDQSDPANRLVPDREETLTLERESRSKLNKDLVRPYDYTKLNSLYEIFKPPTQEYLVQLAHANENDSFAFVHELKQEMHADLKYVESLEKEVDKLESDKVEFSNMYDMLLQECVSNDVMCSYLHLLSDLDAHTELQCLYLYKVKECECLAQKLLKQTEFLRSTQIKDKVVPNTSQVKFKKTEVQDHHRITSISNQTKSVTACNDSLEPKTSNANVVCATCGKCVFNSNHDACVSKYLNDVNARNKKPNVVPISTRIPKSQANKSVTTHLKKKVASKSIVQNSKSYYKMLYEKTSKAWKWWMNNDAHSGIHDLVQGNITINRVYYVEGLNHNLFSVDQFCDADLEVSFRKSTCFVRDLQGNNLLTGNRESDLYTISLQEKTSSTPICLMAKPHQLKHADTTAPLQQELQLLFGPLYDEFFNASTSRVNKSSSPTNNSTQPDTPPTTNIQSSTEPSTTTNVTTEENNDNQAEDAQSQQAKGYAQEEGIDFEESFGLVARLEAVLDFRRICCTQVSSNLSDGRKNSISQWLTEGGAPRAWYDALSNFMISKGFTKGQSIGTPMATKPKVDADLNGTLVDQTDYRSKIGTLMYLTSSRPDIVQTGTINMGLWYPKDSGFELTAFLDVDHVGCIDTRKITFVGIQFLGDKLVSWMSKKQDCTAMSSAEAEYVALSASCAQVMWIRTQLKDYGFNYNKIPLLYGGSGIQFQLKSDSLPHAHAQTTKTCYKHQDSRILKAQELKTKTFANSDIHDLPLRYQVYRWRLLASFQDDAKYEHVGQDTKSQGGKEDQD